MNAKSWFRISGIFLEVSGLFMAIGALIPGSLDTLMGLLFFPSLDIALGLPARFGIGVGGAVLTGWGATMVMLAREFDALTTASVGRAFVAGTFTWFILDGLVSVTLGAYLNLPGNVVYLVAMGAPAWALARSGRAPSRTRSFA